MVVKWMESVDSTNYEAKRCQEDASDMTVWSALFQTCGRGQRGNKWVSSQGLNLTFSILLKPDNILAINQFIISQMASLAVRDYLADKGIFAKIKWPNDIMVEGRKICGILIENSVLSDRLAGSIVGIGLNLNQTLFGEDAPNSTSVALLLKESDGSVKFDIHKELDLFLEHFALLYNDVSKGQYAEIEERYMAHLYMLDVWHTFYDCISKRAFEGKITGVDKATARLVILKRDGQLSKFAFKEVSYIIPHS